MQMKKILKLMKKTQVNHGFRDSLKGNILISVSKNVLVPLLC